MPRHQFTTVPSLLSSIGPLDFLPAKESLYEWHLFLERDNLYLMQFRVSMMAAPKWYSGKWPFCPCRIPLAIQLVLVKDRRDNVMKILFLRRAQWSRNACPEIYKDAQIYITVCMRELPLEALIRSLEMRLMLV